MDDVLLYNRALSASEILALATIAPPNTAPTLNPIGDKNATADSELAFTATASDPDPDTPTFTLADGTSGTVPAGATIGSSSGAFSWTPTGAQVGPTPSTWRPTAPPPTARRSPSPWPRRTSRLRSTRSATRTPPPTASSPSRRPRAIPTRRHAHLHARRRHLRHGARGRHDRIEFGRFQLDADRSPGRPAHLRRVRLRRHRLRLRDDHRHRGRGQHRAYARPDRRQERHRRQRAPARRPRSHPTRDTLTFYARRRHLRLGGRGRLIIGAGAFSGTVRSPGRPAHLRRVRLQRSASDCETITVTVAAAGSPQPPSPTSTATARPTSRCTGRASTLVLRTTESPPSPTWGIDGDVIGAGELRRHRRRRLRHLSSLRGRAGT